MATTTNIGLTKPAGTDKALVSVINSNSDIIDSAAGGLMDAIAIVANGNTHAAISAGQYVYVHNHGTLAEGLYTANSAIAANATLTTSNLTADASGGLNALNSNIASMSTYVTDYGDTMTSISVLQTTLENLNSTLSNNQFRNIAFGTSFTSDVFVSTRYKGTLSRFSGTRFRVSVFRADTLEGEVVGTYNGGTWTWSSLVLSNIIEQITFNSANPISVRVGGYGGIIVVGFAQGIGGVSVSVTKSTSSLTAINLMTGSAWSNSNLTFTASDDKIVIASPLASYSRLVIIKGSY